MGTKMVTLAYIGVMMSRFSVQCNFMLVPCAKLEPELIIYTRYRARSGLDIDVIYVRSKYVIHHGSMAAAFTV